MDTSEVLDLSKENIQPLRQGRKASHLKTALQAQIDPETQQMLQRKREEYEYMIRMYEGNDPLEPYYNYVIWLEQSFPKIGRENNLIQLLEDTLIKFKDCEKYKQDPRLIQLLVKYVGVQSNPLELYQMVYDQGLGTMCSLLYKAWAEEFDKINDIKKADKVYKLGIGCRAQPLNELETAHVQFQLSIARRMIEGSLNPTAPEESSRTVLSKLKPSKVKTTRVSQDTAGILPSKKPEMKNTNFATTKFQVYQEDGKSKSSKSDFKKDEKFPRGSVSDRENVMQAGKWCGQKQRQSCKMSLLPATPSFQIHEDPEAACSNAKTDFRPRALKVRREEFNPPIAVFEPPDPTKKPMYPKQLVYVGGRDVQLEEIRAAHYWRRLEKEEAEKMQNENMDICTNELEECGRTPEECKDNSAVQLKLEVAPETRNEVSDVDGIAFLKLQENEDDVQAIPRTTHTTPTDNAQPASIPVPSKSNNLPAFHHSPSTSMTINTRAAMNIIQQMWESPLSQNTERVDDCFSFSPQKSTFPVYTEMSDIPQSKDSFPIFCDEPQKKSSNPFQVYTDDQAAPSKQASFPVYLDNIGPQICKNSKPSLSVNDPFAVFCDEDASKREKNTFEFNFKTPTSAPPKTARNPFALQSKEATSSNLDMPKANKDLFPVICDGNSSKNQSRSVNKYSKIQISSRNYFADDDDEEVLAVPMGSLKMTSEGKTSSNVISTPLPLIVPINLQDTPLEPENKENQPPKNYSTPSERRPLSGILTPATNVPVQEEEEEEEEIEDSDDDDEDRVYARKLDLDEETCTTRAFAIPLPTSTPFSRSEVSQARKSSIYDGSYISEDNVYAKPSHKACDLNQLMENSRKLNLNTPNLSLILENSKELGCFSSSSSGNAGSKYVTS